MWVAVIAIVVLTALQSVLTLGVQGPPVKLIVLVAAAALSMIAITAKFLPHRTAPAAHSPTALALWLIAIAATLFVNERFVTPGVAHATRSFVVTEMVFYGIVFGIAVSTRLWGRATEATVAWALLLSQIPYMVFLVSHAMSPIGGSDLVFAISKYLGRTLLLPVDLAVLFLGWRLGGKLAGQQNAPGDVTGAQ